MSGNEDNLNPGQNGLFNSFNNLFNREVICNEQGLVHCSTGPAIIWYEDAARTIINSVEYYIDGKKHRDNGEPAVINFKCKVKIWYKDDKKHRVDGPAVVKPSSENENEFVGQYWYNGYKITKKRFTELSEKDQEFKDEALQILKYKLNTMIENNKKIKK